MKKWLYIANAFYLYTAMHAEITKNILESTYQNTSGYGISSKERKLITNQGGNPTYGEATYEAINMLLTELPIGPQDIFYDLGSGTGKVILQCALDTQAQKVIGIELSKTRHDIAQKALSLLKDKKLIDPDRICFIQANFVQYPFNDATIVFMCSTCFSEDLMKQLADKCAQLKPGAHIVSLKQLPEDNRFVLHKTLTLPMSWSNDTKVHWYTRK